MEWGLDGMLGFRPTETELALGGPESGFLFRMCRDRRRKGAWHRHGRWTVGPELISSLREAKSKWLSKQRSSLVKEILRVPREGIQRRRRWSTLGRFRDVRGGELVLSLGLGWMFGREFGQGFGWGFGWGFG